MHEAVFVVESRILGRPCRLLASTRTEMRACVLGSLAHPQRISQYGLQLGELVSCSGCCGNAFLVKLARYPVSLFG